LPEKQKERDGGLKGKNQFKKKAGKGRKRKKNQLGMYKQTEERGKRGAPRTCDAKLVET